MVLWDGDLQWCTPPACIFVPHCLHCLPPAYQCACTTALPAPHTCVPPPFCGFLPPNTTCALHHACHQFYTCTPARSLPCHHHHTPALPPHIFHLQYTPVCARACTHCNPHTTLGTWDTPAVRSVLLPPNTTAVQDMRTFTCPAAPMPHCLHAATTQTRRRAAPWFLACQRMNILCGVPLNTATSIAAFVCCFGCGFIRRFLLYYAAQPWRQTPRTRTCRPDVSLTLVLCRASGGTTACHLCLAPGTGLLPFAAAFATAGFAFACRRRSVLLVWIVLRARWVSSANATFSDARTARLRTPPARYAPPLPDAVHRSLALTAPAARCRTRRSSARTHTPFCYDAAAAMVSCAF